MIGYQPYAKQVQSQAPIVPLPFEINRATAADADNCHMAMRLCSINMRNAKCTSFGPLPTLRSLPFLTCME